MKLRTAQMIFAGLVIGGIASIQYNVNAIRTEVKTLEPKVVCEEGTYRLHSGTIAYHLLDPATNGPMKCDPEDVPN